MASERMRTLLPYVSIGIGILVYVLYYYSTQNWKQAQSDYEKQQVEERQSKIRADKKYLDKAKPWISSDGKKIYKIIRRKEINSLTWIKLTELNENTTYNLRQVESASGEKYSNNAGNIFWIKGDEAIFENSEKKTTNLKNTQVYKGLFSYMADANTFKLCDGDQRVSIAMLGDNIKIEQAYSKLNRFGDDVYLEIEGAMIKEMSMEGTKNIVAIYPYQFLKIEDRKDCK